MRIDHGHDHVRGLDCLQRLDDAELLDGLLHARAAPQARGVDQRIALAVALEGHHDGIAGRARLVECHHAVLAQQPVDQRALADVGAADDGDLDAARLPFVRVIRGEESRERRLEQGGHALIVRGGDRQRLAEPELVEIGHGDIAIEALGLVDREHDRLAAAAREIRRELILRRDAGAAVHDHDQSVGLGDGPLGLFDHQALDLAGVLDQSAGIDHDARNVGAARISVLPVAREAGEVRDQCVAGARHRIEQGRFAHVGPADQRDDGQHGVGPSGFGCGRRAESGEAP